MCIDRTLDNSRISFVMHYTTGDFTQIVTMFTNGMVEVISIVGRSMPVTTIVS